MTTTTRWLCIVPTVAGPDLTFPTQELAEREAKNARALGHQADVTEVQLRVRDRAPSPRVAA